MDLKSKIREIPDWPEKGVNFKDITTLLQDAAAFKFAIDKMVEPFQNKNVEKIAVIDARGFLLGSAIAYKMGVGVCLIRKKGKLPYKTIEEKYLKEYGEDVLTMHEDAILPGENVLMVDDLIATGGSMQAAVSLVEKLGGNIAGISFAIDLPFLGGSDKFKNYNLHSLVAYNQE